MCPLKVGLQMNKFNISFLLLLVSLVCYTQTAITALAGVASATEWDMLRDLVVAACEALLTAQDNATEADVICDGVIDLQGPHVGTL